MRHFSKFFLISITWVACAGFCAATSRAADKKVCSGVDMVAEMRANAPRAYMETLAAAARAKNGGAVFWRISKGDKPPSYLLGTLHLSDPRLTDLSSGVRAALAKASVLALEVEDLSQSAATNAIAGAADLVVFSGEERLSDLLSDREFQQAKAKLRKLGLPNQMIELFKPWVVSLLSAVSDCERDRVKSGELVLDMKLAFEARKRGIPVVGLETLQSQLEAVASIGLIEQVTTLRVGLAYGDRANDLMETIVGLYLSRRIGAAVPFQEYLASKAGVSSASLEGFKSELIVKRNRKMRTRMLALLADGGAFIAVGALHLIGEDGLVALLRKSGYDLTPVE